MDLSVGWGGEGEETYLFRSFRGGMDFFSKISI